MTRTPSRTRTRTTRSSEHTARRPVDAQWFHIALVAQDCLVCVIHVIHACALVVGVLSCLSSSLCPSFSTSVLTVLLPALPDVYLSVQREVHVQPPVLLQLGSVVTSDYVTPLTPHERLEHHDRDNASAPVCSVTQLDIWPSIRENARMLWRDPHAGGFLQHGNAHLSHNLGPKTGNSFILHLWRLARTFKTGEDTHR